MKLKGKQFINLVHHHFEDLELWYPVLRLREEGAVVRIAGPDQNKSYQGKNGLTIHSDLSYDRLSPDEFDGILVPGGWAPDKIRRSEKVLTLIRKMNEMGKPIAQICHAGWVLASADILKGKKATSTLGIKDDMINAGAEWVDESVVVDGNLISSRRPPDLPDYMREFIKIAQR